MGVGLPCCEIYYSLCRYVMNNNFACKVYVRTPCCGYGE